MSLDPEITQSEVNAIDARQEAAWATWREGYARFNAVLDRTRKAEKAFCDALDAQIKESQAMAKTHADMCTAMDAWRAMHAAIEAAGNAELRRVVRPSRLDAVLRRKRAA
jgi:hypothetical protein